MTFFKYKISTKTVCNILTIMLSVLFVCTLFSNYFKINNKQLELEQMFNELRAQAIAYNNVVSKDEVEVEIKEEPIFSTGKQAAIYGFSTYLNYESYSINGNGTSTTSTIIGDYIIETTTTGAKWSDGLVFNQIDTYQTQGNKTFYDKTDGKKSYSYNGERYDEKTKNLSYNSSTDTVTGHYTGVYNKADRYTEVKPLCYTINEETIDMVYYFNVTYNKKGEIVTYEISVELNSKGVQEYAETIQEAGGLSCVPPFSGVTFSMILDKTGNLVMAKIIETYTVSKKIPVIGDFSTTVTNDFLYQISRINESPIIARPI